METQTHPSNPVAAVTHRDPYPYYVNLLRQKPFYRDETLGMWVASSAEIVKAVLTHPLVRVRPVTEPVPRPLLGSPTGEIFGKLVRMNDGKFHQELKPAVRNTLAGLNPAEITRRSHKLARLLLEPGALTNFAFQLPVYVVGSLLGVADAQLPELSNRVKDFVQGLTATATQTEQLNAAKNSATYLLEIFNTLLSKNQLFLQFKSETQAGESYDRTVIVANTVGFLSQTYEATAGLIGNSVLALALRPALRAEVIANPELTQQLVQEVLRYDPPIQNTRRFVAEDFRLAGEKLKAGDTILVLLAAANRDPSVNPEPNRFDLFREKPQNFSFGSDAHACPGHSIAELIAKVAIEELLKTARIPEAVNVPVQYRPSVNARIPLL